MRWRSHDFDLLTALLDPVWFWTLFGSYEGEPIRFDRWQIAHLRDGSRFRAREKSPQIGFSWLSALEAVWDCLMFEDATVGFVSVDQREASEKVLYGKKAYAELPEPVKDWVPMVRDNTDELWFGDSNRPSRMMSIPATSALRGRRMSVYLDEVDFYRDGGRDAFRVAMTRILRGGRVTMGSTCFGVDTQLDRVMQGDERNFSRARLPWTVAENPDVIDAIMISKEEFSEDDFAEEYECVRGGAASNDFPAAMVRDATHEYDLLPRSALPLDRPILLSYDVGATRHPALLDALVYDPDHVWRQRCIEEMRDMSLPDQEAALIELMKELPHAILVVDAQGIGLHMAQTLESLFGSRVIFMKAGSKPEGLEPQDKVLMSRELKRVLEAGEVEIAADKEQALQLRRTRVEGNTVVQGGSKKKTHFDRYWALAYAVYGIRNSQSDSVYNKRGLLIVGGAAATTFAGRLAHRG